MSALPQKETSEKIAPPVHLEFIKNHAGLPDDPAVEEVEAYHRALFLHHHAPALERSRQEASLHEDRLAHLEGRLKRIHSRLGEMEKLLPVDLGGEPDIKPSSPWNGWDRAMFAMALAAIAGLLVFGVLNISFNLLESGLVTFMENPLRAYFWAALLPVGALAVKVGWDFLQNKKARAAYVWACLALGLAGVLIWVGAYASVYPTLSQSTADRIESLSVFAEQPDAFDSSGLARRMDMLIVASQAVAEIFLSAVLGIYLTVIYSRHRPVRLAANPLFTQLDEERRGLEENVAAERRALAEARGNIARLESQLSALVSYARSIFRKESALLRDENHKQQQFLSEIAEQLRSHFNGGMPAEGNGTQRLALK